MNYTESSHTTYEEGQKTCQTIYESFPHMRYYVECDMLSSPADILSAYQIVWLLSFVIQK